MTEWFQKQTYAQALAGAAARFANKDALIFGQRRWTFAEVASNVDEVAKALIASGISPGERVALWLVNRPEWMFCQFAITKIGSIVLPLNTSLRVDDLRYVLLHSGASTLIMLAESGPVSYLDVVRAISPGLDGKNAGDLRLEELPDLRRIITVDNCTVPAILSWDAFMDSATSINDVEVATRASAVSPDDIASIMYTSGTTGAPKGVMHSHHILRNVVDEANRLNVRESDVILMYLPLFHAYGLYDGPLLSIITGARQVLIERFDPGQVLAALEREKGTLCFGFTTHFEELMQHPDFESTDRSSLRAGILAVGPVSMEESARRVQRQFGGKIVSGYGMTEIGVGATLGLLDEDEDHSVATSGYPLPGYEIKVVDREAGHECARGVAGEILVRSYQVTEGYYRDSASTAATIDGDGWLHSGDMGVVMPDGYLRVLGRYKDILRVGAENVDPAEVEGVYLSHPAIQAAVVVPVPDQRLGEVPCLCVVAKPTASESDFGPELLEFATNKMASYKRPRCFVVIDSVPMTASGKVQRHLVRDRALELLGQVVRTSRSDPGAPSRGESEARLPNG